MSRRLNDCRLFYSRNSENQGMLKKVKKINWPSAFTNFEVELNAAAKKIL